MYHNNKKVLSAKTHRLVYYLIVYPTIFGFFIYQQPLENIYNSVLQLIVFMIFTILILLGCIALMDLLFIKKEGSNDEAWI